MSKVKTRKVSRKFDVNDLLIDGDTTLKLSYIVKQSRSNGDSNERYYNEADFIERAVEAQVRDWQSKNYNIEIAPSGLSIIPQTDD